MDIFKKMGITVGMPSLIQEEMTKSLSEKEVMEGQAVRKGQGSNPRDVLEEQLKKGGVDILSIEGIKKKSDALAIEGIKNTHGEEFHDDNDKEVEEHVSSSNEISKSELILKALDTLCEEPGIMKKKSIKKKEITVEKGIHNMPPKSTPSKNAPKVPKDKAEIAEERKEMKEAGIGKFAKAVPKIPGVSAKEVKKIASLHENSPEVAERPKKQTFVKSQGPGGVYFDFGGLTGNPLADNATALLNQTSDPQQAAIAKFQQGQMEKAMINFIEKGQMGHEVEYGETSGDLNGGKMFDKPFDQQVKESFEKGEFGGNNKPTTQAPVLKSDVTIEFNGETLRGMSETDAAVLAMYKSQLEAETSTDGVIAEAGGQKVTIDI